MSIGMLLVVCVACSRSADTGDSKQQPTLHIFTWSDYLDEESTKEFEGKFHVRVVTDTFGSNEELLAKIQAGARGYDIIVPSDYMVSIMMQQGLLAKLNAAEIPNLHDIYPFLKRLYYDPNNDYSVPYLWGSTGIAYNADQVLPAPDSWQVFWDARYRGRISLLNDEREVFGMVLKAHGRSVNTRDEGQIATAKARLISQKPLTKMYTSENYDQLLVVGELSLAHAWSGMAMRANAENPRIKFIIPKEGGTIWQDSLCVLRTSEHQAEAVQFINFLLDPAVAARVTASLKYASANEKARTLVPEDIAGNVAIYPSDDTIAKLEWIKDVGDTGKVYDRAWTELKVQ